MVERTLGLVFLLLALCLGSGAYAQEYEDDLPLDHPAIPYDGVRFDDPVGALARDLASGRRSIASPSGDGSVLPSLLQLLDVPRESQVLVFAKNSLQKSLISPRSPRAIYFGDDVFVSFVPGSHVIELAGIDPIRGAAFYTLEVFPDAAPKFERPRLCLACHRGAATLGVPGVYVSSVETTPSGRPQFRLGTVVTDHRSRFEDRWGGWYVDDFPDGTTHRGNSASNGPSDAADPLGLGAGLVSLSRELSRGLYLSPSSDVVALMVLEHQTQMTNLVTRLGWEARMAGDDEARRAALADRVAELAAYMLFVDETPLPAPVPRTPFAETFAKLGPHDANGRSLRELDLETRLFRYPLSYMVYSKAFDALPDGVRSAVYHSLHESLSDGRSSRLPLTVRRQAIRILRDTKPGLPSNWR